MSSLSSEDYLKQGNKQNARLWRASFFPLKQDSISQAKKFLQMHRLWSKGIALKYVSRGGLKLEKALEAV